MNFDFVENDMVNTFEHGPPTPTFRLDRELIKKKSTKRFDSGLFPIFYCCHVVLASNSIFKARA